MLLLKNHKLYVPIIFSFVILIFLYYPASTLTLEHFHNDDTLLMGRLNGLNDFHSTVSFIFNVESFKFRPIANLQYFIEYIIFFNNYNTYVFYNIFLILIINYIFLLFIYENTGVLACIFLSVVLVSSKLLTYSIWNITGSFESLAVIVFLSIAFLMLSKSSRAKKYIIALALVLILISERYLPFLVALPVLYYYNHSQKNIFSSFFSGVKYSMVILVAYCFFRYLLDIPIIVGTQTDNIVESFSVIKFLSHIFKSYMEIFGLSTGPRYLTGFELVGWVPIDVLIKNTVYIFGFLISASLFFISIFYFFFKCYIKNKALFTFNLISLFLIMAASVTFRLELRWLLPSYLMLLLTFSSYNSYQKSDTLLFNITSFDRTLFVLFVLFSIVYNSYYAVFFRRSLYFAEKLHDSSILASFWMWFQR